MAPLDLDKYAEIAKQCKYLPENDLKRLCDYVCDLLLEESNVQPVSTPVTVCGDIHGQMSARPSMGMLMPGVIAPKSLTC
uniref:Protein phosphatase 6 catalytic subunit n=1 Tax=Astatotilapia calliptera TaxID=8154 RepID=A0AAX7TJL0_ASTCA